MTKLLNPVHFFDSRGNSTLSYDFLVAENKRLEAELEKYKRLLQAQVRKNAELRENSQENVG